MSKPKPLSAKRLARLATDAVVDAEREGKKGSAAHRYATRLLAKKIDDAMDWSGVGGVAGIVLEVVDGPIALAGVQLLGALVQDAWDRLKARRKKAGKQAKS